MKVYVYAFKPFDIVGIFGRQCLLRLGGGIVSQGHDEVFDGNFSLTGANAPPTIRAWLSHRVKLPALPRGASWRRRVKSMFSGFAELVRSLFVGVTQILHGRIDT